MIPITIWLENQKIIWHHPQVVEVQVFYLSTQDMATMGVGDLYINDIEIKSIR